MEFHAGSIGKKLESRWRSDAEPDQPDSLRAPGIRGTCKACWRLAPRIPPLILLPSRRSWMLRLISS